MKKKSGGYEWKTSRKLAEEPARCFGRGAPWKLRLVPIERIEYIDFDDPEFEERARDPKGGPEYVSQLAELMKAGVVMAPAVGYQSRFGDKLIVAHDGNHRICAAIRLGIKKIPMAIYETSKP